MEKLAYKKLLKQAWTWTIKNRRLWWLGLFVGGGSLLSQLSSQDWGSLKQSLAGDGGAAVFQNLSANAAVLSAVTAGLALILLIALAIGFLARAGLIRGLKKLKDNEDYRLKELFNFGRRKIPRLLLAEIILAVPNLFLGVAAGVFYLKNWFALLAAAVILLAVYNIFIALFRHYIYCYAVLEEFKAWPAIAAGWRLLKNNFGALVLAALIYFGLGIAVGLAALVALLIIFLPFVLLGIILMLAMGQLALFIVGGLGFLAVIAAIFIVRAATGAFFQGFLTGVYFELKGK